MVGYAFCGSYCTVGASLEALQRLIADGREICPIMSENAYATDTRFFDAARLRSKIESICGREIIHTVVEAERLGPTTPLESMIIAPCTGNTLAKLAHGITDTSVTMAAKAHLRCDRPLLIALASNDAISHNLAAISRLLMRKSVYFVPLLQDDPTGKPHSLVARMSLVPECLSAMERGVQLRPLFLTE